MAEIAIIMGSKSDLISLKGAFETLNSFGVDYTARVMSAPVLNPDASWTLTEDRHKIRLVHYLERGRIFNRLFERLESFARS